MVNKEVFCTLGPSTLNRSFLKFAQQKKISLVRLNMSHLTVSQLERNIKFIKKNSNLKICIDTEGAQIRTKIKTKPIKIKKNKKFFILRDPKNFALYPEYIFDMLKKGDVLDIGFSNLRAKVYSKTKNKIGFISLSTGLLENNKGVYLINRDIDINFLSEKDIKAISLSKKYDINNFCLSFTNSVSDIKKFKNIIGNSRAIFKIETKKAIKNFSSIFNAADDFLIDRGDLSKEIGIENVPIVQRKIFKILRRSKNKKIAIATNFLESMINHPFPTRAEVNDIFNACEMGATGLVLAAETAIGKYPKECVLLLKKILKTFKKNYSKI